MTPVGTPMVWRKSSHSGGNGGQCVEMAWRKSSYSGGNGGDCVELASVGAIRDSKNSDGPMLRIALGSFVAEIKSGRFDR